MGEIVFKSRLDNSGLETGVNEFSQKIVKGTTATTKKVKEEGAKTVKAYNDELKKAKDIPAPVSLDKVNLVKQLKKEIRDLTSDAIKAGEGTKAWGEALEAAAKKKGELKDLQSAIASLDPDIKARAFSNLAVSGVEALHGIAGAFALAGVSSEDYEKILVRLQGIQGVAAGIRAVTDLKDQWVEAKLSLASYLNKFQDKILAEKVNAALTATSAAEQEAAQLAIKKQTAAMGEATIATKIWNVVLNSNPFLLLGAAILAVVGIIAIYTTTTERHKKAQLEISKAVDGTIIKNKELRDSYNDSIFAIQEMEVELESLQGKINDYVATGKKLAIENNKSISKVNSDTKEKLGEISDTFVLESRKQLDEQIKFFKVHQTSATEGYLKAEEILKEHDIKMAQIQKDADEKAKLEFAKLEKEMFENDMELTLQRMNTHKDILEAGGISSLNVQREIVKQEQAIADKKAESDADAEGLKAINAEKAAQQLIAIDRTEAENRRAFQSQLNNLLISSMKDGHEKVLSLQDENYRKEHETRSEFFNRENELLKEKYDKDLATLNENQRQQAEAIKFDSTKTEGEKQQLLTALDASFDKQRLDSETKFREDLLKLQNDYAQKEYDEEVKNTEAIAQARIANLKQVSDLQDAQDVIDNAALKKQLDNKLITQADYDKKIAENKLAAIKRDGANTIAEDQIALEAAQKKVALAISSGQDETAAVKEADDAKKKLALDRLKLDGDVANAENDISEASKEKRKKDIEDLKATFELVKQAADSIIQAQQDALDQQKKINDDAIAENDRYLGVLATQLANEQAERDAGHANNFEKTENQIALEKEARQKNLEDQKRIQAEQSKLDKIKLIEDKATQASALAVAIGNYIKTSSEAGPILGPILAGVSIAATFVAFAAGLKKAKSAPGFAKGTKSAPPGYKWVGEQGPELINDGGGYRIFTNRESQDIVNNYPKYNSFPKYEFMMGKSLQKTDVKIDTKGIERRIDQSNEILARGISQEKIVYNGNEKIISKGGTTIKTRNVNGR